MQKQNKRPIGRILLDGGFLSPRDLELALEEQRQTNELLGQVLVRMGVLDPTDLKAALSVQEYLNEPEDAVKAAAGTRKMLGELLVHAGHITNEQLDQALAEQQRTGGKLGEVLIRLGLLTEQQLNHVLDFQQNQGTAEPSPLRLGEILISAGYITIEQLDDAIYKQTLSGKKLGEVLVEEGHAEQHHIHHGLRLQHMLIAAVLAGLLTACGGGGGGGAEDQGSAAENVATTQYQEQVHINYFSATSDDYDILTPNFYYSTNNEAFWSIQAAMAENIYDPNFRCVMRIDISKENGVLPDINKTFSIEENPLYEKFPGIVLVPNGRESTDNKVEQGLISFEPGSMTSGKVKGSFDVMLTDYDSATVPAPKYRLQGNFTFEMGTYGPAVALPAGIS